MAWCRQFPLWTTRAARATGLPVQPGPGPEVLQGIYFISNALKKSEFIHTV